MTNKPNSVIDAVEQILGEIHMPSPCGNFYSIQRIRQALTEVLAAAEPILCEAVATFDDGEVLWLLEGGEVALDGGGMLYHIPLIADDRALELFAVPQPDRVAEIEASNEHLRKSNDHFMQAASGYMGTIDELRTQLTAVQAALTGLLNCSHSDPGKGRPNEGRRVTINATAELVEAAKLAIRSTT
jgi:hypothetical protein